MNLIIWLVVGAVLGRIACMVMRVEDKQTVSFSMFVGIIGALLSGWLLTPLFGVATSLRTFSASGLLVAAFGAVVLLALSGFIARGRAR
jgi:uncharacterized membrane protein YeaQ/YmgE (transglycosylase-associated protein family)